MAERPLSERLAEIADLPSIGIALTLERRTALAEAVELAVRVESAPVGLGQCSVPGTLRLIELLDSAGDSLDLSSAHGKRVALVEVPGE